MAGSAAGFGLGESVFDRGKVQMVNINCFTCHAGVVHGQVVAGLGNNHVNQSDAKKLRTRGDNFGPYAVWGLSARLADPAKEGLVLEENFLEFFGVVGDAGGFEVAIEDGEGEVVELEECDLCAVVAGGVGGDLDEFFVEGVFAE